MSSRAQGRRPAGRGLEAPRGFWLPLWLFTASGVAGLIYEVVWSRQLTLVFGTTTLSISTVLTTYMVGLGLGSFLAGRWLGGRPALRVYAVLEAGIGLFAIGFPAVLWLVDRLHAPLFGLLYAAPLWLALARFGLAFLALLPVTLLMGATIPAMGGALVRRAEELGVGAGRLYAWNTLGAALGSGLGGFLLIPQLGLRGSTLAAAAINLAIAVLAWRWVPAADRATHPGPLAAAAEAPAAERSGPAVQHWLLACYGISGFAALAYEVILTRVLILVFGSSVYAFAVVLTGFLLGIGLGSLLFARASDRVTDLAGAVGWLQAVIGLSIFASVPFYDRLPEVVFWLFRITGGSWASLTGLEFLLTVSLLLIPTAAMGAMFPLAARIAGVWRLGAGRAVADAYAVNTVGAVAGAFAGGFVVIPLLGMQWGMLSLVLVNLGLAALLLWRSSFCPTPRGRAAVAALVVVPFVGLALFPGWDARLLNSGAYVYAPDYLRMAGGEGLADRLQRFTLLYYREGVTATVSVFRGQYLFMRVNGKTDAGDSPDNLTQRLLAHVPLLLHPDPKRVLVIGLGSGVTLGAALRHPIAAADAVEISPEVVEASRFFREANGDALADPRAHLLVLDGRTWLTAGPGAYDVIISEPSNPWQTGNANLFTREHFRAARGRLGPGGLLCQWLPYYRMPAEDFRTAVATFQEVFPETTIWLSGSDALMVGSAGRLEVNVARIRERWRDGAIRGHMADLGLATPERFLGQLLLGPSEVARFVVNTRARHTDDWPILEFSGPKALFLDTARTNLEAMLAAVAQPMPLESAGRPDEEATLRTALAGFHRGHGFAAAALREARRAVELAPGSAEAFHGLGLARLMREDYPQAADAFREAVRLKPGFAEALNDLGGTLLRLHRPEEALALFRRAAEAGHVPALYNLGNLYLQMEEPARAREVLQEAVRRGGASAEVWNSLGVAYARQGETKQALAAWDEALRLDPAHAAARRNRDRVRQLSNRPGSPTS